MPQSKQPSQAVRAHAPQLLRWLLEGGEERDAANTCHARAREENSTDLHRAKYGLRESAK